METNIIDYYDLLLKLLTKAELRDSPADEEFKIEKLTEWHTTELLNKQYKGIKFFRD